MPAEPRYRRIGQTNSQMTDAERKTSIAAIKASARDKRLGHLRRQDDHKQAMEKNESVVSEYLENYFGGELNESTSDEDIMGALYDLLETADAVEEFMIDENILKRVIKKVTGPIRGMQNKADLKNALKQRAVRKAVGSIGDGHPWNADTPSLRLSRRSLKRRGLKDTSEPKRAGLPTYMKNKPGMFRPSVKIVGK